MKTLHTTTFPTPLGDFSVAVDDHSAVVAAAFGGVPSLRRYVPEANLVDSPARAIPARSAVEAYFRHPNRPITVALAPEGSAFRQRVWAALRRIPPGETRTYAQIAAEIGSSPRAVGGANGANPLCLFIPCHRVIGADGDLTGFSFGTDLKRRLLELEGANAAPAAVH